MTGQMCIAVTEIIACDINHCHHGLTGHMCIAHLVLFTIDTINIEIGTTINSIVPAQQSPGYIQAKLKALDSIPVSSICGVYSPAYCRLNTCLLKTKPSALLQ
eukprot:TRINITY_DN11896_c0_g1_i11.p1 TRINITY_DN11896_c0_g1~~TRINITY_DN11896_c0_g1_i11.p1  ORF type:complete len:103 (-),score=10.53 TRINITY_DN11896_c0_g1_i11:88-396(-)